VAPLNAGILRSNASTDSESPARIPSSCLLSYELNRHRNNYINGCNRRGLAVICVQCVLRTE
jgi:hypothetical protein